MNNGPFTKDEAEAVMAGLNDTEPREFCPLIKDICHKDCVCFAPPVVVTRAGQFMGNKSYFVYGNCCSNGMFEERPTLQL